MDGEASSILVWERALNRLGGDQQFLAEMIGCFLVDLEGYLGRLKDAAAEGDADLMGAVAHAIQEKASELGAEALARAAEALASHGEDPDLESVVVQAACLRGYLRGLQERVGWRKSTR